MEFIVFMWFLGWLVSFGAVLDDFNERSTWYILGNTLGLVLVWPIWLGWLWRDLNDV